MQNTELKSCAVINDLTGFGRCALNISIPVMSALGVRVLSVPTAVLSNHTGFDEYYFNDLTPGLKSFFTAWEKLSLSFDGIYTGFLGSELQVDIILDFIKRARRRETLLFVDPVMGDNGKLYSTCTPALVEKMRSLVCLADVITPNVTEAAFLAGVSYELCRDASDEDVFALAESLSSLGAKRVVITGVSRGDSVFNFAFDSLTKERFSVPSHRIAGDYCGTGDLFASLLSGYLLRGEPLRSAIERSADFVTGAARLSKELCVSPRDGIAFEPILKELR